MPYSNVPDDLQDKMESCVMQVMEQGDDKETAIAICYESVVGGKSMELAREFILSNGMKAGARNNADDRGRIRKMRELAKQIHDVSMELEPDDEDKAPMPMNIIKSEGGDYTVYDITVMGAVKAAGEWVLDVLGVPFGGPHNGKDKQGEFFSEKTNLYLDKIKSTMAVYYHGCTPEGRPAGEPEIIGEIKSHEKRSDGWWFRVVLDQANQFARRVWEAAKAGKARASSGSIAHMVRVAKNGEILSWPLAELTLLDAEGRRQPVNAYAVALPVMKARGMIAPDLTGDTAPVPSHGDAGKPDEHPTILETLEIKTMDELEIKNAVAAAVKAEMAERAAAEAKAAEEARIKKLEDENAALKAEAAKARRLPDDAPYIAKHSDQWAFDNLDAGDTAVLVGVLAANAGNKGAKRPSEAAYKALAQKLVEDKTIIGNGARASMKATGMKSDEVDYSTLANYGDDWVGVAYSNAIWEAIRIGTPVVAKLPTVEVPQGTESIVLPLESTDPTFYKVAENTTYDSTMKYPVPTITSSQMGTAKVTLSLSKLGARVLWTGELAERSLIPFASQLRMQLQNVGAEYLESAVIDGDNVTTATTNVNDIASTAAQGGTEYYLLFDGFRVSALVTTSANSRSAAGTLAATDYLETLKLMGGAGINALDQSKVSFIVDPNTYYKSLTLPEVLTRDAFASPTIEGGRLRGLFGYELLTSANMHRMSTVRKANSAGKVDQDVVANNAYGAILGVRWDQWKFGFQRRMTIEVDRFAASDTNEIVAMMTCGLIQRDTEASAITYYVGV